MYQFEIRKDKRSLNESLQVLIVRAVFWLNNTLLQILQKVLFKSNQQPSRILIFRTGSLGDNLCALPAIAAIDERFAGAKIDILTNAGRANLVGLHSILNKNLYHVIIDYRGMSRKELVKLLKQNKYDLVIQLPQTDAPMQSLLRDMFFFRYIAPAGWGWQFSSIKFFRKAQEKFFVYPNETERIAHILEENGLTVHRTGYPLNFTEADSLTVNNLWKEQGLEGANRKNIAVVVGAKRAQNRWPLENFKQIIEYFNGENNIILIGGPEDSALTSAFTKLEAVYDYCGKLSPLQSAMVLSKCDLVISNDTGPMHLSYAVGTPVIAIFSSRDFPGKWFPPASQKNIVFRTKYIHCSLCLSENCANNVCMQAIEVDKVIRAAEELLQGVFRKEVNDNHLDISK